MSVAASGAPVASNHLGGGKAESFWIARYGDVIAAALQAGEALSLEVKEKKIGKDQTFFRFASNKESVDTQSQQVWTRRRQPETSGH